MSDMQSQFTDDPLVAQVMKQADRNVDAALRAQAERLRQSQPKPPAGDPTDDAHRTPRTG